MLDLIDYGGGNTGSVTRALRRLELPFTVVKDGQALSVSDGPLILPGVGSFGAVMEGLAARGMVEPLQAALAGGRPFLGICVGLQILFKGSEESPDREGLGLLAGQVVRFTRGKVPQIGWNSVVPREGSDAPGGYAYFVNSYVAQPEDSAVVLYTTDYHGPFCAAVNWRNLTAFQFHPEKSGAFGHELLRRWTDAV